MNSPLEQRFAALKSAHDRMRDFSMKIPAILEIKIIEDLGRGLARVEIEFDPLAEIEIRTPRIRAVAFDNRFLAEDPTTILVSE